MDIQINDFLVYYPDKDDNQYQKKIYNQYEIRKNEYDEDEEPPKKRGEYYPNQEEFSMIMVALNNIILVSGYGSGKTCAIIRGVERIKKLFEKGESAFRKCFYITKGDILEKQVKKQILYVCTQEGEYDNYSVRSSDKIKEKVARENKSLSSYYEFPHYRELANDINAYFEKDNQEFLINKYNNCIFIMDEGHIANNPKLPTDDDDSDDEDIAGAEIPLKKKKKKYDNNDLYSSFIKLFDILPNKKIIVSSATLATNNVNNYIAPINLVNDKNNRIDLAADISDWGFEQLLPYIKNKVMYVKEELPGVRLNILGSKVKYGNETCSIKGIALKMKSKQSKVYENQQSGSFDRKQIEASNLVYPNNDIGVKGFNEYFKIDKQNIVFKNRHDEKYFRGERLEEHSIKDAYIVDLCLKNPDDKIFIYDESVVGSGILNTGKDLELVGYEKFVPASYKEDPQNVSIGNGNVNVSRYGKRKRYAIITQFSTNDTRTIDVYNSPENVTGKIIHAMLVSRKARDGINLYDTTIMVRKSGPRNMTSYMQALYRILRTNGFKNLIAYNKRKGIGNGEIVLNIHNLVAVSKNGKSIDAKMYVDSEKKEVQIKRIFRYIKRASINCHSQIKRNTKGEDYTLGCDYKKCEYKCYVPLRKKDEIRYNEYNILYSQDDIKKCIDLIINMFKVYSSISINNLFLILNTEGINNYIIVMSLMEIIFNKITIRNSFGYSNFLYEKNGMLYISGEFPYNNSKSDTLDSYYSQNVIAFDNQTFLNAISSYMAPKIDKKILRLLELEDEKKIKDKIYTMDLEDRAYLTEYIIEQPDIQYYDSIIDTTKYFLFTFKEPISEIKKVMMNKTKISKNNADKPVANRGRKKKNYKEEQKNIKKVTGDEVKVHSYNLVSKGGRSFVTSGIMGAKTTKIRIFQEGKWRDADRYEKEVYEHMILKKIENLLDEYNQFKYYGSILPDGIFRVINTKGLQKDNKRDKSLGRNCTTIDGGKENFPKIMYSIGMKISRSKLERKKKQKAIEKYYFLKNKKSPQLIDGIDDWKDLRIDYYYNWVTGYNKNNMKELCEILKKFFYKNDMMLIV